MASIASRILFAGSVLCALHVGIADAAQTGGSISLSGGAPGPGCLVTRQVPTTTVQDSFALAASTSCNGGSGSAQIHADALVPSIGLAASVINSSASAFVILSDLWTIGVAPGTAVGGTFSLPVAFHLEGDVTAGSLFGPSFGRFLDISGSLGQFGTASGLFQFNSRVATTGRFDQTFSGLATFTNYGPGVPIQAAFDISLSMPFLQLGAVDFYNTLSATVELPPGFTLTSSSGAALFAVSPVPEAETYALMMAGLAVLGGLSRRRKVVRSAIDKG